MKRFLIVTTILSSALLVRSLVLGADCADSLGCIALAPDEPIVIGAMLTHSGANAFFGEDSQGGLELAVLDRGGELLGREIELAVEDEMCTSEGGQAAAQRLAADPTIVGIIGPSCSSAAQGALPIISEAGMLTVSPSNTSPALTSTDIEAGGVWRPGYYRITPNDRFQGELAAQFAYHILAGRTVATIHDGGTYSESLAAVMREVFVALGGEVAFEGSVNVGDVDMSAILIEVSASGPDVLFAPLFPPEVEFITAQMARVPGLEDTILLVADSALVNTYAPNAGESALGVYVSGPHITGEDYEALLTGMGSRIRRSATKRFPCPRLRCSESAVRCG